MSYRLIVEASIWTRLREHLLADEQEHLAFLLARPAGRKLLVRELIIMGDDDTRGSEPHGLSLSAAALVNVMNRSAKSGLALIEAHSHPFSEDRVAFSRVDTDGQREIVEYLADVLPDRPYGALVFGRGAVCGKVWQPRAGGAFAIDDIQILGETIDRWDASGKAIRPPPTQDARFHRQILALGSAGQVALRATSVAVVGVGGLGSMVSQQLAHLGVGTVTLIDDDVVERTNLHRVVGSSCHSIGHPKVEIAAALARSVSPDANVVPLSVNVRDPLAMEALRDADLIIGCVDTDAGRLILNEFALAYMTPYVDCGVGITTEAGAITEAGGRVVVWLPGRPCLYCAREFDARIAAQELESPEERAYRRQHGYVLGSEAPEPAVVSLNGAIASLAVTEVLALVTGFRASFHYTSYDMIEQRVGLRTVPIDRRCVSCAMLGVADGANLFRYARHTVSGDTSQ